MDNAAWRRLNFGTALTVVGGTDGAKGIPLLLLSSSPSSLFAPLIYSESLVPLRLTFCRFLLSW